MNYKTSIGAIAAALALYATAGCKKDEPIVVHPRVGCSHRDCDNDNDNTYVKPSHDLEPKYGNRTRPELSRHNPFEDSDARENAERLINARRGIQYVIQLPPGYRATTVVPGGPVITTRFRNVEGGAMPPKDPHLSGHNPYVETERQQRMPSGRNPASGSAGCSGSPGSTASGSAGTGASGNAESLEQRLRDCEELNRQLEQQVQEGVTPRHGRG